METTICWPFSAAAAVEAYGHQDNNKPGNIVDGLISGLTEDDRLGPNNGHSSVN
jgi:hypothetical protein